jgi:hypothetical protein
MKTADIRLGQGDMRYGFGATMAGNNINYGGARAQASTLGVNNLLNAAGTAAKAAAAFSDVRLKRDMKRVGILSSGLPVYEFSYIWSPERYTGVVAQEALSYAPWAVEVDESGYLKVRYDLLV